MKTCKTCGMNIPAAARKCPYCHQYQNMATSIVYHPLFSVAYGVFIIGILTGVIYTVFGGMFRGGENFTPYAGQVQVIESRLAFEDCESGPVVSVIGTVQNQSPVTWKDVCFSVSFTDKDGAVIAAEQEHSHSFLMPAQKEIPFQITFARNLPESSYANYSVRVIWAKDDNAAF